MPATLQTSSNPSNFGAPLTLTATVSSSGANGRVTFFDGEVPLGGKTGERQHPGGAAVNLLILFGLMSYDLAKCPEKHWDLRSLQLAVSARRASSLCRVAIEKQARRTYT